MQDLGMLPWEFADLTPREFSWLCDYHKGRNEARWTRLAWAVSHLLSAWVKNAPSPERLLGRALVTKRFGAKPERHEP